MDTPVNSLYHSDEELHHAWFKKGEEAEDHKYVKREWINGKWKYYYKTDVNKNSTTKPKLDLKSVIKSKIDNAATSASKAVLQKTNEMAAKANEFVEKGKDIINSIAYDKDNIYSLSSSDYETKLAAVKETKEWKDIVAKGDTEYVKKNEDGTTTYLIDDYIVDKKHPVLDALGDIAAGRKVDINEVTQESAVAGLRDYANSYIRSGMLAVGVVSTFLTEKFKFQQGSYDKQLEELQDTVKNGVAYVDALAETAEAYANVAKGAADNYRTSSSTGEISPEDVAKLLSAIDNSTNASEAKKAVDDANVVRAAQLILESDAVRSSVGDNEYYQLAESTLTNLSEEEIMLINLLVQQMRNK